MSQRPSTSPPPPEDDTIVRAVIHPSIGIARVGNSPGEFYLGPEVPDPPAEKPGFYRDRQGALKREAARFRVYGVNAGGRIVRELTAHSAEIRWTVHLANRKAAWYGFQLALDIPEAASAPPSFLRNSNVADRSRLVIDPGPRAVTGCSTGPEESRFDTGEFMGKRVYLGELRTDAEGRLIVLGGHGVAASFDGSRAVTFANNEGWHDDVSDGPVRAEVSFQGHPLPVTPAWVVVAPPNYGPRRKSVRTMWDLMRDLAVQSRTLALPTVPSFTREILPIFHRLSGLQWVNAGFAAAFGWNGPFDLTTPAVLKHLASTSEADRELRRIVYNQFRDDAKDAWSPVPWPWVYGDAMNLPMPQTSRAFTSLTATQRKFLQQWAAGDFIADHDPAHLPPRSLEEVPLAEQGDTLDRAALEFCLADAFHPGCEMTWPVRTPSMYLAPFRWLHAPEGTSEINLGLQLTPENVTIPSGPLYGQIPGGITRWMAVPWQTDTASCRSGYVPAYDPYLPTFWPARVPNQVLTREDYDKVMNESLPLPDRLAAFARRADWDAPLGPPPYTNQINNMISHFDHLGVVEEHPGPSDREFFPARIEVEDRHPLVNPPAAANANATAANAATARVATEGSTSPRSTPRSLTHPHAGIEKFRRFSRNRSS